jgi:hypothetical protein
LANLSRAAKRWFVFEPMSTDNAIQPPILSEEERKLFAEHQRFITKARACGTEAGKRLAEIRDRKLYQERFRTFKGVLSDPLEPVEAASPKIDRGGRSS